MTDKRTLETIQQEYYNTAAKAGEAQYKILRIQKDLEMFNQRLLDLNIEAASIAPVGGADKNVG
jgi:hypothetical protein